MGGDQISMKLLKKIYSMRMRKINKKLIVIMSIIQIKLIVKIQNLIRILMKIT